MAIVPSDLPRWADTVTGDATRYVEPGSTKKDEGFEVGEKPAAQFFNWLLYQIYLWCSFVNDFHEQYARERVLTVPIIARKLEHASTVPPYYGFGLSAAQTKYFTVPFNIHTTETAGVGNRLYINSAEVEFFVDTDMREAEIEILQANSATYDLTWTTINSGAIFSLSDSTNYSLSTSGGLDPVSHECTYELAVRFESELLSGGSSHRIFGARVYYTEIGSN